MSEPRIVARTERLLVVDKPSGTLVHPAGTEAPDLVGWLRGRGESALPVHRIDAEASGVVLCASDPAVRAELSSWFAEGRVAKAYLALVAGRTRAKGTIRRPLADARRGHPLPAVTRYRTLEVLGGFSLLRVEPETGRKHQIRRHLQGIGHPLVGDARYGPRRFRPVPGFPGRLWLHAAELVLPDGARFEAPLAPELQAHLDVLRP